MGKLAEEASGSGSGSGNVLQDMVDELEGLNDTESMDGLSFDNAVMLPKGKCECPITDCEENPFPLMLLPAEIRNEIYRACLTRPFNILLSKREPVAAEPEPEPENEGYSIDPSDVVEVSSDSEDGTEVGAASNIRAQAQPNIQSMIPALSLASSSTQSASSSTSQPLPASLRAWASRSTHPIRSVASRSSSAVGNDTGNSAANPSVAYRRVSARPARPITRASTKTEQPREPRPQDEDPLLVNLLRTNKTVYQEARSILYSENLFTLNLDTALLTLSALHQRSRRQIKHCELEIPSYNEILERFQECVRLSLRYCWGLKTFVINMPFTLPGADGSGTTGNTTVYANGFDILRWLPRQCQVELRGNVCQEIEAVVSKNATLAKTLDEVRLAARQHNSSGQLSS